MDSPQWHSFTAGAAQYVASNDNQSFLFTLTNPHGLAPTMYTLNDAVHSIYSGPGFGPTLHSKSYLSDILSMVFSHDGDPSVKAGQSSDNIRAEVDTSDDNDAIAAPVDRINRPKRDYFYDALVSAIGEENIEQMITESKYGTSSEDDSWGP